MGETVGTGVMVKALHEPEFRLSSRRQPVALALLTLVVKTWGRAAGTASGFGKLMAARLAVGAVFIHFTTLKPVSNALYFGAKTQTLKPA
jgi:hypothetical protein